MTTPTDADAKARALVGAVLARGGGRYHVDEHVVTIYSSGAVCTCPWFARNRRAGTCQHIDAVALAQQARATAGATVTIAEDSTRLEGATWLRVRAQQDAGQVGVVLELFDGATLKVAASVTVRPHRIADVIRLLGRVAHAVGLRP